MGEAKVSERCLLVFLDETGHEEFADPGHPVFGIGGCAILSMYYTSFLETPWKALKKIHFGDENKPLHAADLKDLKQETIEALAGFFRDNLFSRLSVTSRMDSKFPQGISNYHLTASSLLKRIEVVASAHPLDSMAIVVEASDRTDKLVKKYLSDFTVKKGDDEIPIQKFLMKKDRGEIGLEVADMIIHTAGAQTRQNLRKGKFEARKDYDAIFRGVPKQLISVFEILGAEIGPKK